MFFFDIERKLFVLIATCFYRDSEKLILLMQRITFGGYIFKKRCNLHFWEFAQKIVKRPAIVFRQNCQNCLFWFQTNNVGLCFFWRNYQLIVFLGFEWKTRQFHEKIFSRFVKKVFFRVQRNIFDEKNFFFIEFRKLDSCSGYESKFFNV